MTAACRSHSLSHTTPPASPPPFSHPLATVNTGRPPLDSSFPPTGVLLASRSPNSSPYGAPKHSPREDTLATMGLPTEDARDTATSVIFSELAMAGTVGRARWLSWDFRG